MKGLEMLARFLVAQLESTILAEPGKRPFHHVAMLSQTAAVGQTWPTEQRSNSPGAAGRDVSRCPVGPVPLKDAGAVTRASTAPGDRRYRVEHRDGRYRIVKVCRGCPNHQGNAPGIGDQVPFAPFFRTIRRVRAGVGPPKSARTEALSMTARDSLIRLLRPRVLSNLAWISGQMPAAVQSRSRRQQVTPLPHPISEGSMRHGSPLRKTKTIPVRQARSATRGRPPSGLGGSTGRRGSISFHNASVTSVNAMASPPCLAWHSIYRPLLGF